MNRRDESHKVVIGDLACRSRAKDNLDTLTEEASDPGCVIRRDNRRDIIAEITSPRRKEYTPIRSTFLDEHNIHMLLPLS